MHVIRKLAIVTATIASAGTFTAAAQAERPEDPNCHGQYTAANAQGGGGFAHAAEDSGVSPSERHEQIRAGGTEADGEGSFGGGLGAGKVHTGCGAGNNANG